MFTQCGYTTSGSCRSSIERTSEARVSTRYSSFQHVVFLCSPCEPHLVSHAFSCLQASLIRTVIPKLIAKGSKVSRTYPAVTVC